MVTMNLHPGRYSVGRRAVPGMGLPLPLVEHIFERTREQLIAFIEIAFISILSRRLVRLVTQEISA